MKTATLYAPGITYRIVNEPPVVIPPPVDFPLAPLVAAMAPGEWREATGAYRPAGMDAGLSDPSPNTNGVVPFCGQQCYDRIRKQIWGRGMDHPGPGSIGGGMWALDLASNAFPSAPKQQTLNGAVVWTSHGYCHSTTDPTTGKRYVLATGMSSLYQIDPDTAVLTKVADATGSEQVIASALTFWNDRGPVWYNANEQTLRLWNGSAWSTLVTNAIPSAQGGYAPALVYSAKHDCMVYGGGNTTRRLYRLNRNNTTVVLNTPDWPIGPSTGARVLCGDGAGEFLVIGKGETWQLDLAGGLPIAKPSYPTFPPGMLEPADLRAVTAACDDLGCMVAFDYYKGRTPQARMWVRKAG